MDRPLDRALDWQLDTTLERGAAGLSLDDFTFVARGTGSNLTVTTDTSYNGQTVYAFFVDSSAENQFIFLGQDTSTSVPRLVSRDGFTNVLSADGLWPTTFWVNGVLVTQPTDWNTLNDLTRSVGKVLLFAEIDSYASSGAMRMLSTGYGNNYDYSGSADDIGFITEAEVLSKTTRDNFQALLMEANGL